MRKIACLLCFFTCFSSISLAQNDTIQGNEAKKLIRSMNLDTTSFLRSAAELACHCIDSVDKAEKNKTKKMETISACIDDEVNSYEIVLKMYRSMTVPGVDNKIIVSDKESEEYKRYYYDLERWLLESCAALKNAIASNDLEREKSYSTKPKAIDAYNDGVVFLRNENYAEALPFFKKAVKLDPEFTFAWDNLGISYRKTGNLEKAEEAYKASLKIDPGGKTPLQNLPVIYLMQKKNEEAIAAYQNLLKYYPDDPEVYYGIAVVYFENLKDMEKALDNICKAYNIYVKQKSPYRSDAEKVINSIYTLLKKDGKEDLFNKILKENNISPF